MQNLQNTMTSNKLRLHRAGIVLGVVLSVHAALPPSAHAQATTPTAGDLESARSLFKQGKELRAAGEVDAALEKFKAAHAYGQTPITGVELGRTHQQLGHLVEAREVYLSIARLKVAPDETSNSAQARREAADLAEQIRPMLASVEVKVGAAAGTTLTIDGAAVPVVSGTGERTLDPGKHVVAVKIEGGTPREQEVVLAQGERKTIELAPTAAPAVAPVPLPPPVLVAKPPPPVEEHHGLHPLVYIGFGTAIVGGIVGGITGALALSAGSKADKKCDAVTGSVCASDDARDAAQAQANSGKTVATVSTIAFIVAGVGAGAGIVGLFLPRGSSAKTGKSISPVLGLGYAGVGGRF